MCQIIYQIDKANLRQTMAVALDVYQKTGLLPVTIVHGGNKVKFMLKEALQLVSGAINEGNYLNLAGYIEQYYYKRVRYIT